jgi:GNAT superfamily N-acetyltransferase
MSLPEAPYRLAMADIPLVRPAQLEDAEAMAEIRADREADVVPLMDPTYTAEREAYWREYGLARRRTFVEATLSKPDQYFAYTAVIGERVVGYTGAEAPPEDEYTYWRGMNIARGYDGQGIGRLLEAERRTWARRVGRPVRALIVVGNDRSMNFFQRQGFAQVDIQEPKPEQPLHFNVMELGLAALNGV